MEESREGFVEEIKLLNLDRTSKTQTGRKGERNFRQRTQQAQRQEGVRNNRVWELSAVPPGMKKLEKLKSQKVRHSEPS